MQVAKKMEKKDVPKKIKRKERVLVLIGVKCVECKDEVGLQLFSNMVQAFILIKPYQAG